MVVPIEIDHEYDHARISERVDPLPTLGTPATDVDKNEILVTCGAQWEPRLGYAKGGYRKMENVFLGGCVGALREAVQVLREVQPTGW